MAVERDPDIMPVNQLVNLLVEREVMGYKQTVDQGHIRHEPRTPDIPAVDRPYLDDAVRVPQRERQGRPVEIDNHPGNAGIDVRCDPVPVPENEAGRGIAIVPKVFIGKEQPGTDCIRDISPSVGNGDQERVLVFHRYQYPDIAAIFC